MRLQRLRLEFRMELTADEMRMIGEFDHFDVSSVRGRTRNLHSRRNHRLFVFAIELVAMAVTFADFELAVNCMRESVRLNLAGPRTQPHGAAEFFHSPQLAQFVDHAVRRCRVELARIRLRQPDDIAGKLNTSGLHSQTDSEVRNSILAGVTNCNQHSLDAALAEAAGHQDSVIAL